MKPILGGTRAADIKALFEALLSSGDFVNLAFFLDSDGAGANQAENISKVLDLAARPGRIGKSPGRNPMNMNVTPG